MARLGVLSRAALVIGSLLLAGLLIHQIAFQHGPETIRLWADAEIRGAGPTGVWVFILAGAAFTGIGLPRQVFAVAAGYVFGVFAGTAYALAAEMLGVLSGFVYARVFTRDLIARRYAARVRRIDDFLAAYPFSMTLAVRLFPVGNNLVVNLLAGVSKVPALPFLAASAVGHLPQTLVFAMIGGGVAERDWVQAVLAALLFGISAVIGGWLCGRYRNGRAFFDDEPEAIAAAAGLAADPGARER